jgi:hypothetical protein
VPTDHRAQSVTESDVETAVVIVVVSDSDESELLLA